MYYSKYLKLKLLKYIKIIIVSHKSIKSITYKLKITSIYHLPNFLPKSKISGPYPPLTKHSNPKAQNPSIPSRSNHLSLILHPDLPSIKKHLILRLYLSLKISKSIKKCHHHDQYIVKLRHVLLYFGSLCLKGACHCQK
jgi:hypothetical protein